MPLSTAPPRWRAVTALIAPFIATSSVVVGLPVHLAANGDIAGAGILATLGALGAFAGAFTATHARRLLGRRLPVLSAFLWLVLAAITLTSSGLTMYITYTLMSAVFSWVSVANRAAIGGWGERWMRAAGPVSRIGAAAGASLSTALIIAGVPVPWLLAPAVLLLTSASLFRSPGDGVQATTGWSWNWGIFLRNSLLSAAGYGPILLYVAFTAATAGAEWVGAAAVAYAAAALTSPWLARHIPEHFHRTLPSWLGLGALANLSWLLTLIHPVLGVLVARSVGGALIFLAEGSADWEAQRSHAHASSLGGRSLGNVVAGAAGAWILAATGSVTVTTLVFASVAIGLGVAAHLIGQSRQRHSD